MPPGPPPGSRAEATALAGLLLSRLHLPPGAFRLPAAPLPPSLGQPAFGCAGCTAYVDVHQVFAVAEPAASVVTFLAAHAPAGLAVSGTGQGSGPGTGSWQEVDYAVQQVSAGIARAQVVVTVVPSSCPATGITVDGQSQPSLADGGTVAALAGQALHLTSRP